MTNHIVDFTTTNQSALPHLPSLSKSEGQGLPTVKIKMGMVITNSLDVSEKFGKRHGNVLATIRKIKNDSPDFGRLNFKSTSYVDEQNKSQPVYEMTRSGFSILAMGFTGKKALDWKIKYETAFNAMEEVLLKQSDPAWQLLRKQGQMARFEQTDSIKEFVEYATKQGSKNAKRYYCIITKETHKALFLIQQNSPNTIRELLDTMQLSFLQSAEYVARNALIAGMASNLYYKDVYQLCKKRLQAFAENVGVTPVINNPLI